MGRVICSPRRRIARKAVAMAKNSVCIKSRQPIQAFGKKSNEEEDSCCGSVVSEARSRERFLVRWEW